MQQKPDLKITDLVWNAENQPRPGTKLVFTITLTNAGDAKLVAGRQETSLTVWANKKPLPLIKFDGGLAVGESKTFESEPWEAISGDHVITATVNFAVPSIPLWNTGVIVVKHLRVAQQALTVPAPAAAAGMNVLTFSDNFTTLSTVDVKSTGGIGYKWYVKAPYNGPALTPDDYALTENGMVLKFNPSRSYAMFMMDVETSAGWGYTHGYMEARFRMPALRLTEDGKGAPPSIWAMPAEKWWSHSDEYVELDFMEYWGDNFKDEDLLYTVTLHHQIYDYDWRAKSKDTPYTFWALNRATSHHFGLSDGDWHVMGWLWEEGRITTYIDGKEVMTQRWAKDGEPEPNCTYRIGEQRKGVFSVLDEHILPVLIHGVESWPLELDYLNIWQTK